MERLAPTGFAMVLREHRVAAGLTQEALAERSGMGVRSIQGLERGESHPRRQTLMRLTEALSLTGDQITAFERIGQPRPRRPRSTETVPGLSSAGLGPGSGQQNNMPVQLTTFVGRERERAELNERLATTRILTLTGTGGCGKTRLALEVASDRIIDFTDGVWLAELASLSDPEQVAKAVATVIGVREAADRPIRETLQAALRSRRLLLVLDNCEHLISGCATLVDALLRACPDIQIIATSREPLAIDGEITWRVPSLSVAPDEHPSSPEELIAYEAGRLFVDRAREVEPSFNVTVQNASAISQICRRLDGIPLAIELAARLVRTLSPEQIAERLDQRFLLFTGGSRAALPRQQTLAATVDWSYNLLGPSESVIFDRLSIFAGTFTLDAAETIAADRLMTYGVGGMPADSRMPARDIPSNIAIIHRLGRLVETSLVLADADANGEKRYRLLETLRQYGRERLLVTGQLDEIRRRHAVYYLERAEEASQYIQKHDQVRWLDRLDLDYADLHAALRWTIEHGRAGLGMRLAASLGYFWYFRGHYSEGRTLRAAVLAMPAAPEHAAVRADVLQGGGMLALHQGDYASARAFLDEAVSLARGVGDPRLLAAALWTLGFVTRVQRDYPVARLTLEEGLALARAVGDSFHVAMSLHHLGLLALESDSDAVACRSLNEETLAIHQEIGNLRMIGVTLIALGRAARALGEETTARALFVEAIRLHGQVGDAGHLPQMLYHLAALDFESGRTEHAVRVAGRASNLSDEMGTRVWPVIQQERDDWLRPARQALGEAAFARAWSAGVSMTSEETVASVLAGG